MKKYIKILLTCTCLLAGCSQADIPSDATQVVSKVTEMVSTDVLAEVDIPVKEMAEDITEDIKEAVQPTGTFDYSLVPEYSGQPYVVINDNKPYFSEEWEIGTEVYSPLDSLGRCGSAYACVGEEIMPAYGEVRGEIGMIKPTGWQTVKYPELIEDMFLYNRCHLIAWCLGAENDNEANLVTGTRYMNTDGMEPFELEVAEYIYETKNHVEYRVTPYFAGDELVCRGVLMEAKSVEDDSICFCVWCYNVQPGIVIDYATGESYAEGALEQEGDFVINVSSGKVHLPSCDAATEMAPKNRMDFHGTIGQLKDEGYSPCGACNPW